MAVPDFESLMQPMLELLADGRDHPIGSVRQSLADRFQFDEGGLEERLSSGGAKLFHSRLGWATTYLVRAGLIQRPRRGVYRITDRGREMLERREPINARALMQFPEMREFVTSGRSRRVPESQTPEAASALGAATADETPASRSPFPRWESRPPREARQPGSMREDSGSRLDEGGGRSPPERSQTDQLGARRLRGVGLTARLSLAVALLLALALLWIGGEMHYNNCLKKAEVTSPDTSGLSTLVRRTNVAKCNRSPF